MAVESSAISLPLIGQFARWGVNHIDLVEDIGDAAYELSLAKSFKHRGEIVGAVLPKIGEAADDLLGPSISAINDDESKKLKGELIAALQSRPRGLAVGAQSRDGKWLDRAFMLIQLILPLLMK